MGDPAPLVRRRPGADTPDAPAPAEPAAFQTGPTGWPADLGPMQMWLGQRPAVAAGPQGVDAAGPAQATHSAAGFTAAQNPMPVHLPLREGAVGFDADLPWIVRAAPEIDRATVSLELYGMDISQAEEAGPANRPVIQNLLQSHQQDRFRRQMQARLDADLGAMRGILLQSDPSVGDRVAMTVYLEIWAKARDFTDATGRSYFDAFLDGLANRTITVTHGRYVPLIPGAEWGTGTSERTYLDELYNMSGNSIGRVIGLIGGNSVKHGGYRPTWHQLGRISKGLPPDTSGAPKALISRATETVLDQLPGATGSTESGIVRDILVGLQPRDQARVLNAVMSRYGETNAIGLGRFGEPTPNHMLYYLFENLDENHRKEVGEALKKNGVFDEATVQALMAGRTLAGQYLPMTTYWGEQAAQFYANEYVQTDNPAWLVGGAFASLWTPETASETVFVLGTAGLGGALRAAPMWVQKTLTVVGTGTAAFGTTQAVMELATGEDLYSGRALSNDELVVRGILAVSNAIFLGAGFAGAHQLAAAEAAAGPSPSALAVRPGGRPAGALPGEAAGAGGARARGPRIIDIDAQGNARVVAQDPMTGKYAYLRINMQTGDGVVIMPGASEPIPVVAGRPVPPRPALPPGEPVAAAPGATGTATGAATGTGAAAASRPPAAPALGTGRPAAPILTAPLEAPPAGALPSGRPQLYLPPGEESFADLAPFMRQTFGEAFGAAPRLMVSPEGVVMPEHPFQPAAFEVTAGGLVRGAPVGNETPLYFPEGPVPQVNFGRTQILVGPVQEGLTPHEIFMPRPHAELTTDSLVQMRRTPSGVAPNMRGHARGARLEVFVEEGMGPLTQRGGAGLRTPMTGDMRFPDLRQRMFRFVLAYEGKNYGRFRTPAGGGPVETRTVPLSTEVRQQITNDAFLMQYSAEGYRPVWVFGDAPPSPALAEALAEARIPYMVYGDRVMP